MSPVGLFYLYVIVLTALLMWPVGRLMWVLSVRRMERRLARPLTQEEMLGQKRRAYFIALFVCLTFAWLFNSHTAGYLLRNE